MSSSEPEIPVKLPAAAAAIELPKVAAPQPAPAPISAAVSDKPQSSQPSPVVQPVVVASDDDIDDEDDTKETDPGSPKDPAYDTDEVLMDSFNAFSLGSKGKVNFSEVYLMITLHTKNAKQALPMEELEELFEKHQYKAGVMEETAFKAFLAEVRKVAELSPDKRDTVYHKTDMAFLVYAFVALIFYPITMWFGNPCRDPNNCHKDRYILFNVLATFGLSCKSRLAVLNSWWKFALFWMSFTIFYGVIIAVFALALWDAVVAGPNPQPTVSVCEGVTPFGFGVICLALMAAFMTVQDKSTEGLELASSSRGNKSFHELPVHAAALVIKAPIRKRDLAATEEKASAQAMPATTPLVAANGSGTPSLSIAITSLQTASPSDKDKDKEVSQTGKDKEKRGEVAISFPCHNAEQLTAILFWQTSKAKKLRVSSEKYRWTFSMLLGLVFGFLPFLGRLTLSLPFFARCTEGPCINQTAVYFIVGGAFFTNALIMGWLIYMMTDAYFIYKERLRLLRRLVAMLDKKSAKQEKVSFLDTQYPQNIAVWGKLRSLLQEFRIVDCRKVDVVITFFNIIVIVLVIYTIYLASLPHLYHDIGTLVIQIDAGFGAGVLGSFFAYPTLFTALLINTTHDKISEWLSQEKYRLTNMLFSPDSVRREQVTNKTIKASLNLVTGLKNYVIEIDPYFSVLGVKVTQSLFVTVISSVAVSVASWLVSVVNKNNSG